MEIKESAESLRSTIGQMVMRICPELEVISSLRYLYFRRKHLLIAHSTKDHIIIIGNKNKIFGDELFSSGHWNEIEIEVLDAKYFDRCVEIAKEYENISQKQAIIVKRF